MKTTDAGLQGPQPTILSFLKDLPNVCSLAGLACTISAIYFIVLEQYSAAMIGMVWAVGFDWADGLIARSMQGRSASSQTFGGQLDLLIDIVSYGVTPAILLLSVGKFEPLFLLGAFIILTTSALRLSYFSTFGLSGTQYTGLALDNNNLVLVCVFMFFGVFSPSDFSVILYVACITLSALNVSRLKTPKLSGNRFNVYLLIAYILGVTVFYGLQLV